jgi:hypothetical protein
MVRERARPGDIFSSKTKGVITRSRFSRDPGDPIFRWLPNWIARTLAGRAMTSEVRV